MKAPECFKKHRAGDGSYLLYDMNHIPVKRACDRCRVLADPTGKLEKEYNREEDIQKYIRMFSIFQPNTGE